MRFVDTNIILRYLTRDDPAKAAACYALFQRLQTGAEQATTGEAILAEVVYVLASPRQYRLAPSDIRARLIPIISLRGLKLPHKRTYLRALDLYATHPGLDFEDALALAQMAREHLTEIYSYDTDFDVVRDVTRIEP